MVSIDSLRALAVATNSLRYNPELDPDVAASYEQILVSLRDTLCPVANLPLTLDELRAMNGEPVWVVTLGVEDSGHWELCSCEIITACPLHEVLCCTTADGDRTDYEFDTYEKTWRAYRQKVKEES